MHDVRFVPHVQPHPWSSPHLEYVSNGSCECRDDSYRDYKRPDS